MLFDMLFQYVLGSWEGSAGDGWVFLDARSTNFQIPEGRYYLADGEFGSCNALLVPYRNIWYHLKEWEHGQAK
jgi:hypothetical protein